MNKMTVVFGSPEEINKFVEIVRNYPYEMDLGRGRFIVDAKSVLGIMNLGIRNEITLRVYAEYCNDLKKDIKQFIAA